MVRLAEPGLAFSMPTRVGHLVGVVTHAMPKRGTLVWIAKPTFADPPSAGDVSGIDSWRWPVVFLAETAIRRKLATRIGMVSIPEALRDFPTVRSGDRRIGWVASQFVDGEFHNIGETSDWSLPIYQMVNDTALREMVEADWRPEEDF